MRVDADVTGAGRAFGRAQLADRLRDRGQHQAQPQVAFAQLLRGDRFLFLRIESQVYPRPWSLSRRQCAVMGFGGGYRGVPRRPNTSEITMRPAAIAILVLSVLAGATTAGTKIILALTHVVAAAIVIPALLRPEGHLDLLQPTLLAGLVAAGVAWKTRNVGVTVVVGIALLAALQQL